jgi:hypothetical protein
MSIISLSPTRRQILASVIYLTSFAASIGAAAAETAPAWTITPGSAEEQLHTSNGRETEIQIARSRPSYRDVAARVRDERSNWSAQQWDAYARSMGGQ